MRIVVDTNTLVSGSLWGGNPGRLLDAVKAGNINLLQSPQLRDPKNLLVLVAAAASHADAIVTGEDDLISLESFEGIPIMNARDALLRLGLPAE